MVVGGKLREIAEEVKSSTMENKATAILFVLILTGQLGFLSTVMKDGVMTRIDIATTPSSAALREFLLAYPKQVYITQSLHL